MHLTRAATPAIPPAPAAARRNLCALLASGELAERLIRAARAAAEMHLAADGAGTRSSSPPAPAPR